MDSVHYSETLYSTLRLLKARAWGRCNNTIIILWAAAGHIKLPVTNYAPLSLGGESERYPLVPSVNFAASSFSFTGVFGRESVGLMLCMGLEGVYIGP